MENVIIPALKQNRHILTNLALKLDEIAKDYPNHNVQLVTHEDVKKPGFFKAIQGGTLFILPQETLEAFLDHGEVRLSIEEDLPQAMKIFCRLSDLGISIDQVTAELESEGVSAFKQSFDSLIAGIEAKRLKVLKAA